MSQPDNSTRKLEVALESAIGKVETANQLEASGTPQDHIERGAILALETLLSELRMIDEQEQRS